MRTNTTNLSDGIHILPICKASLTHEPIETYCLLCKAKHIVEIRAIHFHMSEISDDYENKKYANFSLNSKAEGIEELNKIIAQYQESYHGYKTSELDDLLNAVPHYYKDLVEGNDSAIEAKLLIKDKIVTNLEIIVLPDDHPMRKNR